MDNKEITKIEALCRKAGHLDPHESLLDRIKQDQLILEKYGLKKQDIYTNHRNMGLKYNLFDRLIEKDSPIKLNGLRLKISCVVWMGAEQCPIERYFSTDYHGYERGNKDWLITNLNNGQKLRVPDLLPSQVGMFGFCQSPSSAYRLDLEKYIRFFDLNKMSRVKPLTIHNNNWILYTSKNSVPDNCDILDEIDNDIYHAFLVYHENEKYLYIHFYSEDWQQKHEGYQVDIFGEFITVCIHKLYTYWVYKNHIAGRMLLFIQAVNKNILNLSKTEYSLVI